MPDKPFPFTSLEESDIDMFIQWKGTDVCVDIRCSCGYHGHVDGYFADYIKCGSCGVVYEMGTKVIAKKIIGVDIDDIEPLVAI